MKSSLPKLPRLLHKKEADITPWVIEWFKKNWPVSVALEIKVKGGKLKHHQKLALGQVKYGAFGFKIPDTGRRNPFDAFVLSGADAFIVECDGKKCVAKDLQGNIAFKLD